jgi:hypothetical protein
MRVVLKNNLDFPVNIMAGGVRVEAAPALNPGDVAAARSAVK